MTRTVDVWCESCDWEEEISEDKILSSMSLEEAAQTKAAGHVMSNSCRYGSTSFEFDDD